MQNWRCKSAASLRVGVLAVRCWGDLRIAASPILIQGLSYRVGSQWQIGDARRAGSYRGVWRPADRIARRDTPGYGRRDPVELGFVSVPVSG